MCYRKSHVQKLYQRKLEIEKSTSFLRKIDFNCNLKPHSWTSEKSSCFTAWLPVFSEWVLTCSNFSDLSKGFYSSNSSECIIWPIDLNILFAFWSSKDCVNMNVCINMTCNLNVYFLCKLRFLNSACAPWIFLIER